MQHVQGGGGTLGLPSEAAGEFKPMPPTGDDAPVEATLSFAGDDDSKLKALRWTKFIATAALALCVVVFMLAKYFEPRLPWLGFVAAFAEAATIGGLADWY